MTAKPRNGANGKAKRKPRIAYRYKADAQTAERAETLAGYGVPQDQIACVLGISEATLKRHYAEHITRGHIKANAEIGKSLFQMATGQETVILVREDGTREVQQNGIAPVPSAAIFWAKTQMGWSEDGPKPRGDVDDFVGAEESALEKVESRIAGLAARLAPPGNSGKPH